ncbi:MAG: glucosyltransferase domain-containing protein [Lachnospiraceae bacterium]
MMEFDVLDSLKKKIKPQDKLCFLFTCIFGVITHFYVMTNKLPNWDEINTINSYGSGDFLGRWFLRYVHKIGGSASMPAVHGFLAVVFIAMAACIVLSILKLKSTTSAILIGLMMVTFPSVISNMTFMFMTHTSSLTILFLCFAVYVMRRFKWGAVLSTVIFICSMGIYQSYISIAITLILMGLLFDLFRGGEVKTIVIEGIKAAGSLILSVAIYIPICYYYYPAMKEEAYGGISQMGQINIMEVPVMIARCYKRILEYFIWKPYAFVSDTMQFSNIAICIIGIFLFVYLIYKKGIYKDKIKVTLVIFIAALLPFAAAFVYFMAPDAPFSMLMLYAYVFIYVLAIGMLELSVKNTKKRKKMIQCIAIITVIVTMLSAHGNYILANRAYLRMQISYERVTSYFNRIITRVEGMEGYQYGENVAILGEFYYVNNPSPVEIPILNSEDLRELSGVALENGLITSGVRDNFIRTYIGFEMGNVTSEAKDEIINTKEFQNMAVFPAEGSIQKVNGIWVVKLCEMEPDYLKK